MVLVWVGDHERIDIDSLSSQNSEKVLAHLGTVAALRAATVNQDSLAIGAGDERAVTLPNVEKVDLELTVGGEDDLSAKNQDEQDT